MYLLVQVIPGVTLPTSDEYGWSFNPFAWQFLMILGMVVGALSREQDVSLPRIAVPASLLMICYGIFSMKAVEPLQTSNDELSAIVSLMTNFNGRFDSKTHLGPLRLFHFLSVACVVGTAVSRITSIARSRWGRPFVICGRNSLSVYCIGVLLAYLSAAVFNSLGSSPLLLSVIIADAIVIQILLANALDRRRGNGQHVANDLLA